jgi:hypothetical protein
MWEMLHLKCCIHERTGKRGTQMQSVCSALSELLKLCNIEWGVVVGLQL